ncbi:hypothetical protein PATSB16_20820 [Pandoraea thiooxydans]|nr:hypothetical protein PATSB16_20820 [Pandoraea thiooxydans]
MWEWEGGAALLRLQRCLVYANSDNAFARDGRVTVRDWKSKAGR